MTITLPRTIATLALLAGLAACGTDSAGTADPSGSPSSTETVVTPPSDFAKASAVTLVRGGGLAGDKLTLHFAAGQPPPAGFTAADVVAVLTAAADPALKKPLEPPEDTCCDRYVYAVTVILPDGTSHSFTTVDGAVQIPAVAKLLHLMAT